MAVSGAATRGFRGESSLRLVEDTTQDGAQADRITDFSHAQGDRIDLSAIDWDNDPSNGHQAFTFTGEFDAGNPTGPGDVSYLANTTGPGTYVFFDLASGFRSILVLNVTDFVELDFVL